MSTPGATAATLEQETGSKIVEKIDGTKPFPIAAKKYRLERPKNVSSNFWNWFHEVTGLQEGTSKPRNWPKQRYACCNFCGKILVFTDQFGKTTLGSLKGHAISHQKSKFCMPEILPPADKKRPAQLSMETFFGPTKKCGKLSAEETKVKRELAVAVFVASTMSPIDIVENQAFRKMISAFNSQAEVMGPKNVREKIICLHDNMRRLVFDRMKGQTISLTIDHWTSMANQNYTGMTSHWIDEAWNLHMLAPQILATSPCKQLEIQLMLSTVKLL